MNLCISGVGIIFYSPWGVAHIPAGANYLETSFMEATDVSRQVNSGQIAAFCTGTPGDFEVHFPSGSLDEEAVRTAEFKVRLALEVRDGCVCFRDLYELLVWNPEEPPDQQLEVANGFYRVTVYSSTPEHGVLGEEQQIYVHFERQSEAFAVHHEGVPMLCPE
jgi:hypothetical protein